jgi:hypothetical protein
MIKYDLEAAMTIVLQFSISILKYCIILLKKGEKKDGFKEGIGSTPVF